MVLIVWLLLFCYISTIYAIQWTNETNFFYKNISLILFSKGPTVIVGYEIHGKTYLRGRTSSSHIFFQEPGGANACTPLQARQWRPDRLRVLGSTAILCTLSKSDRELRITWSSSGYTPVRLEGPDVLSYPWQLVRAHGGHYERTENPCHVL